MKKPVLYWIVTTVLTAAASATVAYFIGKSQSDSVNDDIMAELEALRVEQSDAAVVKRVSQQMEDIAYLQKAVSDQERDRAAEQSKLAMAMRDRAEQESRIAREAQNKAMAAVEEAEQQRAKAFLHQMMAEEQRDAANEAKSISDTLNFRAIGRTIGNTSVSQFESGNTALAGKLAYASWYFLDNYRGNTYQPESFNALSLCSGTSSSKQTQVKGNIRALYPVRNKGCITVTDYGELKFNSLTGEESNLIIQNRDFDFRDVWTDGNRVFALSLHGPLCETDLKKPLREIPLPPGDYLSFTELPSGHLFIAAKRLVLELDRESGQVIRSKSLDKDLVTIVRDAQSIILFFSDGTASRSGNDLELSDFDWTKGKKVTAAYYDNNLEALFTGYENGDVEFFNRHGEWICTIFGQVSRISDIITFGTTMVAASYDKSVCIWNLPLLKLDNNGNLAGALDIPSKRLGLKHDTPSTEWAAPVSVNYRSWPLALGKFNQTEVIVGTADGEVHKFDVSTDNMASIIKKNQDITLTSEEWDRYISAAVEYIDMK